MKITVCKGCSKPIDEDDAGGCIHCSAVFCYLCEKNGVACACQQALNQIWDAEEAAAARVAALAVN